MTVGELLKAASRRLSSADIDGGARDARTILRHLLASDAAFLDPEASVSPKVLKMFEAMIEQRCLNQPVSQIIGRREFWGREFKVSRDTLDPRPESELLIELALGLKSPRSILDLGTGTGCLLLTLLAEIPGATGLGVDISEAALKIARQNAAALDLSGRGRFVQSDWFERVSGKFDLIVCNPPYISQAEMRHLDGDVFNWEPHCALTPGGDGLSVYRLLAKDLSLHLSAKGNAIFEIGERQAGEASEIFMEAGFEEIEILKDINGKDRAILLPQTV